MASCCPGYDPQGRLHQTASGGGTTQFLYSGADLVAEYDESGNLVRRYVPGPGTDEPLVWYQGSGTADRRWLHADVRGTVVAVTDSSGAMIATFTYDPYGSPSDMTGSRFLYTGQIAIPEAGLFYYKARIYSPILGRFLQTDPAGYGAGMNLYMYVSGDPINRTDPSGLCDDYWTTENGMTEYVGAANCNPPSDPPPWELSQLYQDSAVAAARANQNQSYSFSWSPPEQGTQNVVQNVNESNGTPKMSPEEQEKENEKDELICRLLQSRACWQGAYERRARRAVGKPVPPPELNIEIYRKGMARPYDNAARAAGTATLLYWLLSEGSRLFPPRNLVPIP